MDDEEFKSSMGVYDKDFFIDVERSRGVRKTPEQEARDDRATEVREKVAACERAQWLPIARADAIRTDRILLIAFAPLPPVILLLLGIGIASTWKRFGKVRWLGLPEHLRKGLFRLYLVITAPWVAWFGYHLLDVLQRHGPVWRYVSGPLWKLLLVPIGGPILILVIIWVVTGFRKFTPDGHGLPKTDF